MDIREAVCIVALRKASLWWWSLSSPVVRAKAGLATDSSDMPFLSVGRRPDTGMGFRHRHVSLRGLVLA